MVVVEKEDKEVLNKSSQSQEFPGQYFTVTVFSLSDICLCNDTGLSVLECSFKNSSFSFELHN